MRLELSHVEPLRAANIAALIYGAMTTAFALMFLPFIVLVTVFSRSEGGWMAGPLFGVFMLVVYPILGLVMGWISGFLSSLIYNLVTRWTGGLLLQFRQAATEAPAT